MAAIRSAALISVGTVAGQALVLASMPVISRLYSPQDLGHLALYVSVVGMFSPTAALCYELAIPLPKSSRDAQMVSWFALAVTFATAVAVAVAVSIRGGELLTSLGGGDLRHRRYWVPVGLLLSGLGTVLTVNVIRAQRYGRNALSMGLQGGAQAGSQVVAGWLGLGWLGLMAGQILGIAAGIAPLLSGGLSIPDRTRPRILLLRTAALAKKYRNFPLLSAPSTLVNSAGANLPALLLASLYDLHVVGLYGLGYRVLQLPARLFGQSLSQVFLGQAAAAMREDRLATFVEPAYRFLVTAALHVFMPIAILARPTFSVVFGPAWKEAGAFVQYMMPWVMVGFISTPLSMLVSVLQKQRQELWLQVAYVMLIVIAFASGALLHSARLSLMLFGGIGAVFLSLKIWWLLGIAGCRRDALLVKTLSEFLFACAANLPLVVMLVVRLADPWIMALGCGWALAVQWINLRIRRVYAF